MRAALTAHARTGACTTPILLKPPRLHLAAAEAVAQRVEGAGFMITAAYAH